MRIKFLKPVGDHKVGDFLTVEDAAVAKQYVAIGLAEEAPDLETGSIVSDIKGLFRDAIGELRTELQAETKGSKGPRIDPVNDPEDADQPPRESDSPDVRRKKFGRFLQLIGALERGPDGAKRKASETLQNCYKSAYSSWEDRAVIKAANVESVGVQGGYTVPPEFSTDVWKIAVEDTVLASRARKRPMTSNEFRYPKLDQTGTAVAGSVTGYLGGVVAKWQRETSTRQETEPKLKQGVLKAGELTGYSIVSNELLQDNAVGLASMLSELFAEAIAYYTDLATLVGDGVDKPRGVIGAPATLSTLTRTTSGHFKYADAVGMKSQLLPVSLKRAFWIINQTVMPDLYNMVDGSGRLVLQPYYPGSAGGPASVNLPETLLNLPMYFTEKTPALGTVGDVVLCDPLGYMIGERMGLEIAASPHVNFLQNEMTYRFVARIAGQPMLDAPFTMLDGTNKLSTFVTLPT